MKLKHLSKMIWIGRAALVAAVALLSVNAVRAAEFFDDSIIRGTKNNSLDDVADGGSLLSPVSLTAPASGPINLGDYKFSHASSSPDVASAQQPSTGAGFAEIMAVPVPEPATGLAVLGVLGFVGYRERRRIRSVWSGGIVPTFSLLGSLVSTLLGATAKAFTLAAKPGKS